MSIPIHVLGRAVKRLQSRHHKALDSALIAVGTTLAQWDALRAIDTLPGANSHALAEYTFQTDQAFGALASKLVALGLAERREGKGRALAHGLTDAGKRLLEQGNQIATEILTKSFSPLTDEQRMQLFQLLELSGDV